VEEDLFRPQRVTPVHPSRRPPSSRFSPTSSGNPSSIHWADGTSARRWRTRERRSHPSTDAPARGRLHDSGTEADNLAVKGCVPSRERGEAHRERRR